MAIKEDMEQRLPAEPSYPAARSTSTNWPMRSMRSISNAGDGAAAFPLPSYTYSDTLAVWEVWRHHVHQRGERRRSLRPTGCSPIALEKLLERPRRIRISELDANSIAKSYLYLVQQDRSAWSWELATHWVV
ncbi:hypothetical protein C8Q74DRAFT_1366376 [Fomes fomentarius]|nr:hypothetical protein C8Q74DRAFT_1366376 [Fomes fomentarius]